MKVKDVVLHNIRIAADIWLKHSRKVPFVYAVIGTTLSDSITPSDCPCCLPISQKAN